jgi:uncharacterized protein
MPVFVRASAMPVPVSALSDWHFHPGALDRLLPPWEQVRILQRPGALADGAVARVGMRALGRDWTIVAVHRDVRPGEGFTDEQQEGPFARWVHRHSFLPHEGDRSTLEDRIEYELPGGALGRALGGGRVAHELERAFVWRHHRTRNDLTAHARFAGERLRVAVSGTNGMVGGALVPYLTAAGHDVRRIVRGKANPAHGDVAWDDRANTFDARALEGLDAVVHLAGAGITDERWTDARKRILRDSRVLSTRALARTLAGLHERPRVLVCASAIGWYGSRDPDDAVTEDTPAGRGFLPEVCQEWEAAADEARAAGIRVVHLRIGVVVGAKGGVLGKLLAPFKLGLGGTVGNGRQVMSWVALDDLLGMVRFAIGTPLEGPVNAVAPEPVDNRTFGRTLASVLGRPAMAPLPAFAVRLALGEMGQTLLLEGCRVRPDRLQGAGFQWTFPALEGVLRFETGRIGSS